MSRFTYRSPRGWVCDWCSKTYYECECDPRQRALEAVADAARAIVDKQAWCSVFSVELIPALADALDELDKEV